VRPPYLPAPCLDQQSVPLHDPQGCPGQCIACCSDGAPAAGAALQPQGAGRTLQPPSRMRAQRGRSGACAARPPQSEQAHGLLGHLLPPLGQLGVLGARLAKHLPRGRARARLTGARGVRACVQQACVVCAGPAAQRPRPCWQPAQQCARCRSAERRPHGSAQGPLHAVCHEDAGRGAAHLCKLRIVQVRLAAEHVHAVLRAQPCPRARRAINCRVPVATRAARARHEGGAAAAPRQGARMRRRDAGPRARGMLPRRSGSWDKCAVQCLQPLPARVAQTGSLVCTLRVVRHDAAWRGAWRRRAHAPCSPLSGRACPAASLRGAGGRPHL